MIIAFFIFLRLKSTFYDEIQFPSIYTLKPPYADSGYGNLDLAHAYVRLAMFTRPIPGVLYE